MPVVHTTADWTIDVLEHGMQSGASSLMLIIPADVEHHPILLMIETSVNAWMMAAAVIASRCADEIERPGWAVMSDATRELIVPRYVEAIRRAIPSATVEQAEKAASMALDSLGSGDGR